VIDGPQSVVWDEAENRMHVQKALMEIPPARADRLTTAPDGSGRRGALLRSMSPPTTKQAWRSAPPLLPLRRAPPPPPIRSAGRQTDRRPRPRAWGGPRSEVKEEASAKLAWHSPGDMSGGDRPVPEAPTARCVHDGSSTIGVFDRAAAARRDHRDADARDRHAEPHRRRRRHAVDRPFDKRGDGRREVDQAGDVVAWPRRSSRWRMV
jgi:hypothetical protein